MTEFSKGILSNILEPTKKQPLATLPWVTFHTSPEGAQELKVAWPYAAKSLWPQLQASLEQALAGQNITVQFTQNIKPRKVQGALSPIPGIKNIIAIASGKGGVGKSTVTANLAHALLQEGAKVGVLDADIYGPSQPTMLGARDKHPEALENKKMAPIDCQGIKTMSIGYLVETEDTAMIWRGPMVSGALTQMLQDTVWGEIDYLLIDLPPGTGDIQLTLAQKIPVTGAVIVTTPQDIALLDARKAYTMFRKVGVTVLGVIENMSLHRCSQCGHEEAIFGEGGGARMARQYDITLLGQLPLDREVRLKMDKGEPLVAPFIPIAHQIGAKLAEQPENFASKFGKIVIKS